MFNSTRVILSQTHEENYPIVWKLQCEVQKQETNHLTEKITLRLSLQPKWMRFTGRILNILKLSLKFGKILFNIPTARRSIRVTFNNDLSILFISLEE